MAENVCEKRQQAPKTMLYGVERGWALKAHANDVKKVVIFTSHIIQAIARYPSIDTGILEAFPLACWRKRLIVATYLLLASGKSRLIPAEAAFRINNVS